MARLSKNNIKKNNKKISKKINRIQNKSQIGGPVDYFKKHYLTEIKPNIKFCY